MSEVGHSLIKHTEEIMALERRVHALETALREVLTQSIVALSSVKRAAPTSAPAVDTIVEKLQASFATLVPERYKTSAGKSPE